MRKIKIKYDNGNEDNREVADEEFNSYMYRLNLDKEIHNRDNPDNKMIIELEDEADNNEEQIKQ